MDRIVAASRCAAAQAIQNLARDVELVSKQLRPASVILGRFELPG